MGETRLKAMGKIPERLRHAHFFKPDTMTPEEFRGRRLRR
ncbi:hypothetical protein ASZ90_011179 [hydrocarbon metagenome]|uniref:Uncharacterized protein n=1 Tax=hydrocarbon metagenome TaxID=938273 RepID=A0A0W8FDW6_9ZZZZ